ncbi:MAG: hypothetical protein PHF44_03610 [Candidatus Pacebacteria bacterium]|nr:hypothetical protein [Candidatus Paceibacterota bacterium]
MSRKTRTILFSVFVFLFFIISPVAVLYSQGYRFDFANKKITKTGGIFLKISPKQADIYIDGKPLKKTDFFSGSALLGNLLPKTYKISVKKDGFQIWEKNLEVQGKEVTEAKNIILFPEKAQFSFLSKGIQDFWVSSDGKKVVFKETDSNGWALKLYNLEKNVKSHLIGEKEIYAKGADFTSLEWSQDQKELYLKVVMKEQEKNFALKLDRTPPALVEKIATSLPENIIVSQKYNNDVYYLNNLGYVYKSDATFSPEEKINETPFPVQQETEYNLIIFSNYIFLKENQALYSFNSDSKSFEKIFEGIRDLKISPDNKKIVYSSDSEIWVLFLEDQNEQPQRNAGEKVFLTRFSENIGDVFWLNSDYLIFNIGDKIKIAEIDNRDRVNIYDLGEFTSPKIFFAQNSKKLYFLSNDSLSFSENLIP